MEKKQFIVSSFDCLYICSIAQFWKSEKERKQYANMRNLPVGICIFEKKNIFKDVFNKQVV